MEETMVNNEVVEDVATDTTEINKTNTEEEVLKLYKRKLIKG